jgi:uncharacterized protein DUF3500
MSSDGQTVASRIGVAVASWLDGLDPEQRSKAAWDFDTPERFIWDYRPGLRRGVSLGEMIEPQRTAALAILDASLSDRGAAEVRAVMALETILGELEHRGARSNWLRRDPDLYWFAVFGDPAGHSGAWSWRVGGHHVAIQATIAGGEVVGGAPSFLGSNPATVPDGPHAGRRAIDGEEALARSLLLSLSPDQRQLAVVDPVAPPDILSGNDRSAALREVPSGISADRLVGSQRDGLERLIGHYLGRCAPEIAAAEWERIRGMGLGAITFAWAGGDQPGQGHYYAIRGPRLLIEYDNTQNGANHIHAVWRDPTNDWGDDLLAGHYRTSHRPA